MSLQLIEAISRMRERLSADRGSGRLIGLVPTMGALHAGHFSLIERARAETTVVVVSIFVNPLQFDRPDDLASYPVSFEEDLKQCTRLGVDVVFAPTIAEMYPSPIECTIEVGHLGEHLCGRTRPGHFRGVATIVTKLLNVVQPDRAYFGEKDAQQLAIVRRLVSDLNMPVRIVPVATVRDADGLALSSRNQRLSGEQRGAAPALYRALNEIRERIESGNVDVAALRLHAAAVIGQRQDVTLEYLDIVDPDDLQPVSVANRPVIAAGAIWLGSIRLIDNILCVPPA